MTLQAKTRTTSELAGSLPLFPGEPGNSLARSSDLHDFSERRLIFNRFNQPGSLHVYSANCKAGERLRVQLLVPALPGGDAAAPAFAVIAQSLPYSADVQRLPVSLPAGYSAVVAPAPAELVAPLQDLLTRATFYPGPVVDTRTLVAGRCYIVVWAPQNQMGKYALRIGHTWPWSWLYWLQVPLFWWQVRGWFGLSRAVAYVMVGILIGSFGLLWGIRRRKRRFKMQPDGQMAA
jgi:hypothetical protein